MTLKTKQQSELENIEKIPVKKYYQIYYNITEAKEFTEYEYVSGERRVPLENDKSQTFPRTIEVAAFSLKQVQERAYETIIKAHNHFKNVSKIAIKQIIKTDLSKFFNQAQLERLVDLTK